MMGVLFAVTSLMLLGAAIAAIIMRIPVGGMLLKSGLLTLFAGGYEEFIGMTWLTAIDTAQYEKIDAQTDGEETVLSFRLKAGAEEDSPTYTIEKYRIETDTGLLRSVESTHYNIDDDSVAATQTKTIYYDDTWQPENSAYNAIIRSTDYCELNLVLDYGSDKPEVQFFPVAHDTKVLFWAPDLHYTLYADAELTQKVDQYNEDFDLSRPVCNIFVVYDKS